MPKYTQETPAPRRLKLNRGHALEASHHCTRSSAAAAQMLVRRVTAVFRGVPIVEVVVVQVGVTRGGAGLKRGGGVGVGSTGEIMG